MTILGQPNYFPVFNQTQWIFKNVFHALRSFTPLNLKMDPIYVVWILVLTCICWILFVFSCRVIPRSLMPREVCKHKNAPVQDKTSLLFYIIMCFVSTLRTIKWNWAFPDKTILCYSTLLSILLLTHLSIFATSQNCLLTILNIRKQMWVFVGPEKSPILLN